MNDGDKVFNIEVTLNFYSKWGRIIFSHELWKSFNNVICHSYRFPLSNFVSSDIDSKSNMVTAKMEYTKKELKNFIEYLTEILKNCESEENEQ